PPACAWAASAPCRRSPAGPDSSRTSARGSWPNCRPARLASTRPNWVSDRFTGCKGVCVTVGAVGSSGRRSVNLHAEIQLARRGRRLRRRGVFPDRRLGLQPARGGGRRARAPDGHFWAEAMVNGKPVRALVDTGASVVALTREDALRLGLDLRPEDFDQWVGAAGGPARAARIQLAHVSVAGARVERVEAMVIEDGLPASLLGMSYLGRLSRIEATPAGLTLRP